MANGSLAEPFNSRRVWKVGIVSSLGSFLLGYNIAAFSSIEAVSSTLDWGDQKDTWITIMSALMPLGAVVGGAIAGGICERVGRRKGFMFTNLVTLIGSLIIVLPDTIGFGLGRFTTGLGVGLYTFLVPLYLNEVCPVEMSGKVGTLVQIQINVGVIVAYAFTLVLPTEDYDSSSLTYWWMFIFGFQALIGATQFLAFLCVYKLDTSVWYLKKGLKEEALESLKQIYSPESAEEVLEKLETKEDSEKSTETGYQFSYKDLLLCRRGSAKLMRLGYLNNVFQQMSGINAIITFSVVIFGRLGGGVFMSRIYTLIVGVVNMLASLMSNPMIEKAGRKFLNVGGLAGMAVCHLISGIFAGPLSDWSIVYPMCSILAYLVFFQATIGPVCYVYCGEIMDSEGMSICMAVNWFSFIVIVPSFTPLENWLGISVLFWIYSLICFAGFVYFKIDMVESKGLSKQEIQKKIIS